MAQWNSDKLSTWISVAKNLEKELEEQDIGKVKWDVVYDNLSNLLVSVAEDINRNENKNIHQLLYDSVIPLLLQNNQSKSLKESKSDNDIKIIKIDPNEEVMETESHVDYNSLDDYIRNLKNIQEKLEKFFSEFPNHEHFQPSSYYRDLNIVYLAFPFEIVYSFFLYISYLTSFKKNIKLFKKEE